MPAPVSQFVTHILHTERVARRVDLLVPYLAVAVVAGAVLAAASLLPLVRDVPLIPCYFKEWTGWPCPFCGLTRSFVHAGHAEFAAAWIESPLAAVLYACVAAAFLLSLGALIFRVRWRLTLPAGYSAGRVALLLALAVLANWFYRLAAGLR